MKDVEMMNININQYVSNFRIILFSMLYLALSVILFMNVPYENQLIWDYIALLVGIAVIYKLVKYKTTDVSKSIKVPKDLLKPLKTLSNYYLNALIAFVFLYHILDNLFKGNSISKIGNVSDWVLICIIILVTFKIILKLLESTLIKKYMLEVSKEIDVKKQIEFMKFKENAKKNLPKDRKQSTKKSNNKTQQKTTKGIRGKIK